MQYLTSKEKVESTSQSKGQPSQMIFSQSDYFLQGLWEAGVQGSMDFQVPDEVNVTCRSAVFEFDWLCFFSRVLFSGSGLSLFDWLSEVRG